jgi:glycosyltransferase involved in cell wall biosynthesis
MRPIQRSGAGGIEKYLYFLSRALADQGHEVSVIDIKLRGRSSLELVHVIEVRTPHFKGSNDILHVFEMLVFSGRALLQVLRLVSEKNVDVIHTHTQFSVFTMVLARRILRLKIPVVHTLHNPNIFAVQKRWSGSLEIYGIRHVDLLVTFTNSNRDRFMNEFDGIRGRIEVIPLGTDEDRVNAMRLAREGRSSGSGGLKTMLCVGRISPRKNQMTILKAMSGIARRHEEVRLVLVGPIDDPSYLDELRKFIRERNIDHLVRITGELSTTQLCEEYERADIFVFPSLWEGQPQALIEAMQMGIPAVASNVQPIKDTVTTGDGKETCLLCEPMDSDGLANAVIRLLEDEELRRRLGDEEMTLGMKYSWKNISMSMASLYSRLTTNPQA